MYMTKDPFHLFVKDSSRLKVYGKSLLYKVDLELSYKKMNDVIEFACLGELRLGPKRSKVLGSSTYNTQKMQWQNGYYKIEGFKVNETFYAKDNELSFEKSKQTKISEAPFFDPISLFFILLELEFSENNLSPLMVLIGKKIRSIDLEDNIAFYKGKKWVSIFPRKNDVLLKVLPFKLELKVFK